MASLAWWFIAGMLTAPEYLMCVVAGYHWWLAARYWFGPSVPATVGFNVVSLLRHFYCYLVCRAVFVGGIGRIVVSILFADALRVFNLYSKLTVHRGIVHSIPYLGLWRWPVYASFMGLSKALLSVGFGAVLMFGAIVHLLLDEMFSVNLLGLSVKNLWYRV